MKDRQSRIITGCNFISELIKQRRTNSNHFRVAAKRLIDLLQAEINGDTDVDLAAEIFQTSLDS